MKKTIILLALVAAIFVLNGCEFPERQIGGELSTTSTDLTSGKEKGIEDFSENEFESNQYMFSEISAVTLYQDGVAMTLNTNDSRIIRLLNFLSFAVSKGDMTWMQGHPDAEWMREFEASENRLEIVFSNDLMCEHGFDLKACEKLIVSEDCCVCVYSIGDTNQTGLTHEPGKMATCFIPYRNAGIKDIPNLLLEARLMQ